jgi:hypothetical protein
VPARAQVQVQVQEARVPAREAQDAARVPALVRARERAWAPVLAQGSVRARVPEALAQVRPDAAALARAEGVLALAAQVSGARILEAQALGAQALGAQASAARALAAAAAWAVPASAVRA